MASALPLNQPKLKLNEEVLACFAKKQNKLHKWILKMVQYLNKYSKLWKVLSMSQFLHDIIFGIIFVGSIFCIWIFQKPEEKKSQVKCVVQSVCFLLQSQSTDLPILVFSASFLNLKHYTYIVVHISNDVKWIVLLYVILWPQLTKLLLNLCIYSMKSFYSSFLYPILVHIYE